MPQSASASAKLYFEDTDLGDEIGPFILSVTRQQVIDFCALWGNPHPNRFTDPDEAAKVGLDAPIVPGIMSMALVSRALTDWAGAGTVADLDLVFRGSVPHHQPLHIAFQVSDTGEDDAGSYVQCDITMTGPAPDRPYVIGTARLNLPTRS